MHKSHCIMLAAVGIQIDMSSSPIQSTDLHNHPTGQRRSSARYCSGLGRLSIFPKVLLLLLLSYYLVSVVGSLHLRGTP